MRAYAVLLKDGRVFDTKAEAEYAVGLPLGYKEMAEGEWRKVRRVYLVKDKQGTERKCYWSTPDRCFIPVDWEGAVGKSWVVECRDITEEYYGIHE